MKFTIAYTPEHGQPQEWDFDPTDPNNWEAEALESVGGEQWETYDEWSEYLARGSYRARRALLWVLLNRTDSIGFDDVSFRNSEFNNATMHDVEPGKAPGETSGTDTDST
jgi:hypothetical protein